MKFKKGIFLFVIGFVVCAACMWFLFSVHIKMDKVTLLMYPSVKLSEDEVAAINSSDLVDTSSYFNDVWEIRKLNQKDYGTFFELDYHFDLTKYIKWNDYIVEAMVDDSDLEDAEKVFFAESTGGLHDQYIFEGNGNENKAVFYISMMGNSYQYDEAQLLDIVKKLKIKLWIQDKNGRISQKKVNVNNSMIDVEEASEHDIESSKDVLGINE